MAEGFFNSSSDDSPGVVEVYITNIEEKSPQDRTNFEKEVLQLYNKAQEKGTKFCTDQIKQKAAENLANNWAYYLLAIVVLIFVFNRNL